MDFDYLIKGKELFMFVDFDSELSKEFLSSAKSNINNLNKEIIDFSRKIGFDGKIIKVVVQGVVIMTITFSAESSNVDIDDTKTLNNISSADDTKKVTPISFIDIDINKYYLSNDSGKFGMYMNPSYIMIHNTANSASSYNEIKYLHSLQNRSTTSFHFAVDDEEIWQALPTSINGWHAGDGKDVFSYNRNSIGVEIAKSTAHNDLMKDNAIENAAKLTAYLMIENDIPIENVIAHNDASGKYCPHDIYDRYGWDNFIERVVSYL